MNLPPQLETLFRQTTPLFLLGVVVVVVAEPWLPGTAWLRATFGEQALLRACVAALGLYVLLLWGESLRLHTILSGVLRAFRDFDAARGGAPAEPGRPAEPAARHPKARLEAAKLLVAALRSDDPEIRRTSRHNLGRLAGRDLGDDPAAWQRWIADQERGPPGGAQGA